MSFRVLTLAAVLVLPAALLAQGVSAVITPNPALPGQTVIITITEANGVTIQLPTSCVYSTVRYGTPTGPVVYSPICLMVITPVGPCASRSQTFTPTTSMLPGTYWFQVSYWDPNFSQLTSEFFSFNYQAALAPAMNALTPALIGQDLLLDIVAPQQPGYFYYAAASLTTNTGFPVFGNLYCSLDLDFVFALSFPVPDPILFANFQGVLSTTGQASGIAIHIPNLPALLCKPLHAQAVLLPPPTLPGQIRLTNPLNFTMTQ